MANQLAKAINRTYHGRHVKKSSKGAGHYALTPKGVGPNSVHDSNPPKGTKCHCGGCTAK